MAKMYSSLILPASGDCNLNCAYCYRAEKRDNNIHRMSMDVLEKFTYEYIKLNPTKPSFGWQGGEPLLMGIDFYKKAIEFQNKYKEKNTDVSNSIQTNGILINDEWAKFFKENNFLVGVSIDGPSEYHDLLRVDLSSNPTLKRVLKGIDYLKKYEVDFNVLTVINKYNVKHAIRIFQYFIDNGFYYIQQIPSTDFDRFGKPSKYTITPDEYANFICTMLNEWIEHDDPSIYINIIDIILHSYMGYNPPYCVFTRSCDQMITVDYNGDVYPCDFFVNDEFKIGNIMKSGLEQMFKAENYIKYIQKMHILPDECKSCKWFFTCHGGCMRHMDVFKTGRNENYLCPAYKKIFGYYFNTFDKTINNSKDSNIKKLLLSLKDKNFK